MSNDYTYEIALTLLPGVGCRTARQLLNIVGSAEEIFQMDNTGLRQLFGNHREIIKAVKERIMFNKVESELKFVEKNKIRILYYTDSKFPQRLNRPECIDAPILLYCIGDADFNNSKALSVVGTRTATERGKELTHKLVDGFAGESVTIVSGLAIGIDTAAHTAALQNNLPTIAVLAHGLDRIYPHSNRSLAKRILQSGGALVTEMRSETDIMPGLFPARNRIIAALGDATVVVEASKKGGALITANIADGYHREIFAFPGRIEDKQSEGCNAIIANGKALLIRGAGDVFTNMGWRHKNDKRGYQTTIFPKLEGNEEMLFRIISEHQDCTIEDICGFCDLPMPTIAATLLSLELKGHCRCLPGKVYRV